MAVKKFSLSVPEEVMDEVDRAATERGLTRSAFVARVLARVARARSDAEVTRRIDALFGDPALAREQRETAAAFASARSEAGTEW